MNATVKRYALSSLITFVSVFTATIGLLLSNGAIDPANLSEAVVVGVGMAALRAACKAVIEAWAGQTADPQS